MKAYVNTFVEQYYNMQDKIVVQIYSVQRNKFVAMYMKDTGGRVFFF